MHRLPAQLLLACAAIAAATLARIGLGLIGEGIAPFSLFFPAILLAALIGGWRAGAAATVLAATLAWSLFVAPMPHNPRPMLVTAINLALNTVVAGAIVAVASYVRTLIERLGRSQGALAARDFDYDVLFQAMAEGFALCEVTLNESGRLADYVILNMNPALQRMLGVGPEAIGTRLSDAPGNQARWMAVCDGVMTTGEPAVFEYHNRSTDLWHEIHISRVTPTRMAQVFFDITDRKAAQARQAELFDELNHRVKNNLGIVSAVLSTQARRSEPAVGAELMKAVDRVQSIAEVHASLYVARRAGEVDFGAYLENLCERLSASLLDDDRISIQVVADADTMSVDRAVPLGMVVNELVTNAVKYAYPAPERGLISVSFQRAVTGAVLTVGDGGAGLPNDFENSGGLGLKLLRSMAQQVGGRLTIRRHPGATFEIHLPDMEAPAAA